MVADADKADFPKYEYIAIDWGYGFGCRGVYDDWHGYPYSGTIPLDANPEDIPKDLLEEYKGAYEELLYLYDAKELEEYRRQHGNQSLMELYMIEYGC